MTPSLLPSVHSSSARLWGAWDLVEWVFVIDGHDSSYPMGSDAKGRILYQPTGYMSATLMAADRPWPAGRTFLGCTPAERSDAALNYVAYAGRFELQGDTIVHHVELSLYPEQVGTDLVRTVTWSGVHLILETPDEATRSGRKRRQRLTWTRVA